MRFQQINQIEFKGASVLMSSFKDDWGTDDMVVSDINRGAYHEGEAMTWWLAMLNCAKAGNVVVDAGAYSGLYSLLAAKVRGDLKVVAIEASAVTFGRLVNNILINRFDAIINPNHVALSIAREVVPLGHAFGTLTMSSGESLQPTYETDHTELVAGVTLDDLLVQDSGKPFGLISSKSGGVLPISCIAGMKVDLEGVEYDVLKSSHKVLQTFTPPIVIELLTLEAVQHCTSLLEQYGYKLLAECEGSNFVFCTDEKALDLRKNYEIFKGFGDDAFRVSQVTVNRLSA